MPPPENADDGTRKSGERLRALREAHGLSLGATATRAGLAKSTLSQWERGLNEPRIYELEALLTLLGASPTSRENVLRGLASPRATGALRESNPAYFTPLGDLILALRLERGWSQARMAEGMGVSAPLVSRWESGRALPSSETRTRLLDLLGAPPSWRDAILTGEPGPSAASERLHSRRPPEFEEILPTLERSDDRTIDPLLLGVRAAALGRVREDGAWRALLVKTLLLGARAHMGRGHTERLSRWAEEGLFWTAQDTALTEERASFQTLKSYVSARRIHLSAAKGLPSARTCAREARRLLALAPACSLEDRAWALRAAGRFLGWAGDHALSARLHREALDAAHRSGSLPSLWATEFETGTGLLTAGDAEGAMRVFTSGTLAVYSSPDPQLVLRWCETQFAMGETRLAEGSLLRAAGLLNEDDLPHRLGRQRAYQAAALEPVSERVNGPGEAGKLPFLAI